MNTIIAHSEERDDSLEIIQFHGIDETEENLKVINYKIELDNNYNLEFGGKNQKSNLNIMLQLKLLNIFLFSVQYFQVMILILFIIL